MKKLLTLAICALSIGFLQADPLDVSGFAKSITITVSSTSVAQGVSLADFPVLVRLSTAIDGFSYSDFQQQNGGDIAFLDSRGNVLAHEIDTWNTDGESLVWVKVPVFSRSTRIYIVYGNSSYSSSVAATDVWSGYAGVWHLGEATGSLADSTGHSLSASRVGGNPSLITQVSGPVGNAIYQEDEEGNSTCLEVPSYDSLAVGGSFAVSGWFNADSVTYARLFSRGTSDVAGFEAECGSDGSIYVRGSTAESHFVYTDATSLVGNWTHVTVVYDDTAVSIYVNGILARSGTTDAVVDNGNPFYIGCSGVAGNKWSLKGKIDEFRLLDAVPSADWIAADYATVTEPGFLSFSAAEVCSLRFVNPSEFTKFVQITASASAVPGGGVIENFPALVRLSEGISGFHYSDFMANGADLVFADEDGVVLASEIDTWNTSGESIVWVKVPVFENGMTIYAYWGAEAVSSVSSTDTWSGFTGVWHMNESGSTVEPDVSGNGLDATPNGTTSEMESVSSGAVGKARINQSTQGREVANCLYVPSYPAIGDTFTASGWFNASYKEGWHRLISRKTAYGTNGWEVEMRDGSDEIVSR